MHRAHLWITNGLGGGVAEGSVEELEEERAVEEPRGVELAACVVTDGDVGLECLADGIARGVPRDERTSINALR